MAEVFAFLEERIAFAIDCGIAEERICVDPGIGFGKTPDQNLELVRRLDDLVALGRPIVVGLSRKSTLGKVLGDPAATRGRWQPPWEGRSRRSSAAPGCCARTTFARRSRHSRLRLR